VTTRTSYKVGIDIINPLPTGAGGDLIIDNFKVIADALEAQNTTNSNIGNIGNVVIASPANGQVLKYNSSTSKWVNGTDNAGDVTQSGNNAFTGYNTFDQYTYINDGLEVADYVKVNGVSGVATSVVSGLAFQAETSYDGSLVVKATQDATGAGNALTLQGGNAAEQESIQAEGGSVIVKGGTNYFQNNTYNSGATITVASGTAYDSGAAPVRIGGNVTVSGGDAYNDGGNVYIMAGNGTTGAVGQIFLSRGNVSIASPYTLTGNGSGLNSLDATALSTGTLADARLSNNIPLKNGSNTFTNATNTFNATGANFTKVIVKAGSSQSTTNMQEWITAASSSVAAVGPTGEVRCVGQRWVSSGINNGWYGAASYANGTGLVFNSVGDGSNGVLGGFAFAAHINQNTSGVNSTIAISRAYSQTSTAGSVDLKIVRTDTTLGSGTHRFLDCYAGSAGTSNRFYVSTTGGLTLSDNGTTGTLFTTASDVLTIKNMAGFHSEVQLGALRLNNGSDGMWSNTALQLRSDSHIQFSASTNAVSTKDLGVKRQSAGTLQITDGSSGYGSLFCGNYYVSNGNDGYWGTAGTRLKAAGLYSWSATSNATGSADTALIRNAAAQVKITDGSTGIGQLDARATNYTTSSLPASSAATKGRVAFASDGRKNGEGAAAGTGVLCYDDGTAWRRVSDDTTVAA